MHLPVCETLLYKVGSQSYYDVIMKKSLYGCVDFWTMQGPPPADVHAGNVGRILSVGAVRAVLSSLKKHIGKLSLGMNY
jgi:hypothetical protein